MNDYKIIGLAGRKQSGKTTLAKEFEKRGWVRMAFADSVKELALKLDPTVFCAGPVADGYWTLSELVERWGWDLCKQEDDVRRFLQVVGTELGRAFDKDIWVDKLAQRLYRLPAGTKVIIDDVRFQNEADKIRHFWGGKVIRLEGGQEGDDHISETGVDQLDVSFTMHRLPPPPWDEREIDELVAMWEAMLG